MSVKGTPLYGREFLKATEDELKTMLALLDKHNYTEKTLQVYAEWALGQAVANVPAKTIIDDMEDPWDGL